MSLSIIIECTEFSDKDLDFFKKKDPQLEENKIDNNNTTYSCGYDDLDDGKNSDDCGIMSQMKFINNPEFIKTPSL